VTILKLKDAIGSFQSKDMAEIVKFHQHVEQQLVCLTDEAQVLDLVSLQHCVVVDKVSSANS
jgi:hypothetical protein